MYCSHQKLSSGISVYVLAYTEQTLDTPVWDSVQPHAMQHSLLLSVS